MLESDPRPEIAEELASIRARLIASVAAAEEVCDGLDDEDLNRRPEPGSWSVCECLDHLVVVGEKLGGPIDDAIARGHREGMFGRGPFRYGLLERWFARASSEVDPPKHKRVRTMTIYEPRSRHSSASLLGAYGALQRNMVERVEAANGLDLARIKVTSPATRWVRLSLGQWFALIAGHQERHLAQARRARARVTAG